MNDYQKQIASYFAHGLKVRVFGQTPYEDMVCDVERISTDGQIYFAHAWNNIDNNTEYFKPLLIPLSKLTEEIEHNGETFVPMDKLIELLNYSDTYKKDIKWIKKDHYTNKSKTAYSLICKSMVSVEIHLHIKNKILSTSTSYSLVQQLLEWHFDIYGMIEKGQAIKK